MKQDNNTLGKEAKIKIRANILNEVGADRASVLDLFCGEQGEMHAAVWSRAKNYSGVDIKYNVSDDRRRYVGDNRTFAKWLDLSKYNVFDVDSYGSPWEIMEIISKRRMWLQGTVGAVAFTDCDMRPNSGHKVMGLLRHDKIAKLAFDLHRSALSVWFSRSRVRPKKIWQLRIDGPRPRWYCGVVFEGLGREKVSLDDVLLTKLGKQRSDSLAECRPIDGLG